MSIRDRVRRALRNKSDSASVTSDSASQSDSSPATPVSSNTSQSSDSTQSLSSKLSRTFTWGSRDKDASKDKSRRKRPLHPSERPLTAQNLRHQQMLGQFTMTFGTSNLSQLDLDGVSPCCTRAPSIDGLAITPGYSQHGSTSFSEDEIAPA